MMNRDSSRLRREHAPPNGQNTVRRTATALVAAIAIGGLAVACNVHGPTGPGALFSITVEPDATMAISATHQFTAVGTDADGNVVAITPDWSIVSSGGTINSNSGLFTAGMTTGEFLATVQATSGGISGTATVTVIAGGLASIGVTPNPATLLVTTDQLFVAVGRDAGNNVVPITPAWSVINGGGSINAGSGLFTAGLVAGTFSNTVRAMSGLISGTATVDVTAVPPPPSPLGSASNFGILAGTGISCAISGSITGGSNIGSSPTLTVGDFPPCTFDGIIPAPAVVATAKDDLTAAYIAAQGEVCNVNLTGIDLGFYNSANPLPPGVYCFDTSAGLTGTLELAGSATAKWTFQIGSTLIAEVGSEVILSGGAIEDNVYWAAGSSATLRTNSTFQGNIMVQAAITLEAGATLLGRALAQDAAVDMTAGGASIVMP